MLVAVCALAVGAAKQFVELHGGRIWLESTLGIGTTFTFTLPLDAAVSLRAASSTAG